MLVVMINRPFSYNYDIQPFHPCAILQGVVERKHDRKTETVAVTQPFRSTVARWCKQTVIMKVVFLHYSISDILFYQYTSQEQDRFLWLYNVLMPVTNTERLKVKPNSGFLWPCWFPSVGSPCFWLPLSFLSDTHILNKTRSYRLPMPVNGSFCNYDYVEPCAPGTGLSHDVFTKQKKTW